MNDIPIISRLISLYSESVPLINSIPGGFESNKLAIEGSLTNIVHGLICAIDEIEESQSYEFVGPLNRFIESIMRIIQSISGFAKLNNSVLSTEVRMWLERGVEFKDQGCNQMIMSFKRLLELICL